jgi:phosphotransferase system  glucose/maltose/N-acetylglucosamine-specific IIC component
MSYKNQELPTLSENPSSSLWFLMLIIFLVFCIVFYVLFVFLREKKLYDKERYNIEHFTWYT